MLPYNHVLLLVPTQWFCGEESLANRFPTSGPVIVGNGRDELLLLCFPGMGKTRA